MVDEEVVDDDAPQSPLVGVGGFLFLLAFGAVFAAAGGLMIWGTTRGLGTEWPAHLESAGYGSPEQIRAVEAEHARYASERAAWQQRHAAKPATAPVEEVEAAADEEPSEPALVPKPMPGSTWERFAALSVNSRKKLFAGPMAGVVFLGIGLLIMFGALTGLLAELPAYAAAKRHPTRFWLHDREWARLQGRADAGASALWAPALMFFVFGWAAFCTTLFWWADPEPGGGFTAIVVAAVLVASLIGMLLVREVIKAVKFGRPALLLAQVPCEPGKQLQARLALPPQATETERLEAVLSCVQVTTTGSGKHQRTHEVTVLRLEATVPRAAFVAEGPGQFADLAFELPSDATETRSGTNPSYHWTLELSASTPGVDYAQSFTLPVYRLPDESQRLVRTDWTP